MSRAKKSSDVTEWPFATERWLSDERLGMCSPATRGVWIDALCAMYKRDRCGELQGSVEQLMQLCRCVDRDTMLDALDELQRTGAGDVALVSHDCPAIVFSKSAWKLHPCPAIVRVVNRRMKRDHDQRVRARETKRAQRCPENVPPMSPPSRAGERDQDQDLNLKTKRSRPKNVPLPDWLDGDVWREFKQWRSKVKKALTREAELRAFKKLDVLREKGNDANAVVQQSIDRGWSGLFPVENEDERRGSSSSKSDPLARVRARREAERTGSR